LIKTGAKLFAKFRYKVKLAGKTIKVKSTAANDMRNPLFCDKNNLTEPTIDSVDQISNMPSIGTIYVQSRPGLIFSNCEVVCHI
jgi:hypothetical protein